MKAIAALRQLPHEVLLESCFFIVCIHIVAKTM
jgi:hypothetical protein